MTEASQITEDIISRGKVPIVVGGTPFYLCSYIYNTTGGTAPQVPDEVKLRIGNEMKTSEGRQKCWEKLQEIDPEYAKKLSPSDTQRIIRSLSIYEFTGKTFSSYRDTNDLPKPEDLRYDFRCLTLYLSRDRLFEQIDLRCEQMVYDGLLREVHELLSKGELSPNKPARQAIGYRQAIEFIQKGQFNTKEFYAFLHAFQSASRQFCRSQLVSFRGEPIFKWVPLQSIFFREVINTLKTIFELPPDQYENYFDPIQQQGMKILTKEQSRQQLTYMTDLKIFYSPAVVEKVLREIRHLTISKLRDSC